MQCGLIMTHPVILLNRLVFFSNRIKPCVVHSADCGFIRRTIGAKERLADRIDGPNREDEAGSWIVREGKPLGEPTWLIKPSIQTVPKVFLNWLKGRGKPEVGMESIRPDKVPLLVSSIENSPAWDGSVHFS